MGGTSHRFELSAREHEGDCVVRGVLRAGSQVEAVPMVLVRVYRDDLLGPREPGKILSLSRRSSKAEFDGSQERQAVSASLRCPADFAVSRRF